MHNPGAESTLVQIELYGADGKLLLMPESVELAAGASRTVSFGEELEILTSGWAKLTSSSPFSAQEMFQLQGEDYSVSRVGVEATQKTQAGRFFGFVQGEQTNTALAIANPSETES